MIKHSCRSSFIASYRARVAYTQRSRSFLYAAIACVVARLLGNNLMRFFENGIVSINFPISEQVVGARATRTTHPLVLDHFREFFSAAVGKSIDVDNPFIWKTKGDVIRSIVDRGCGAMIKDTISCTRVYDITKLHTHCGCCSQCLDRRFAVLAAGDPSARYRRDTPVIGSGSLAVNTASFQDGRLAAAEVDAKRGSVAARTDGKTGEWPSVMREACSSACLPGGRGLIRRPVSCVETPGNRLRNLN